MEEFSLIKILFLKKELKYSVLFIPGEDAFWIKDSLKSIKIVGDELIKGFKGKDAMIQFVLENKDLWKDNLETSLIKWYKSRYYQDKITKTVIKNILYSNKKEITLGTV